jgi:hypothetical protein
MPLSREHVIEQHGRRYVLFSGLLSLAHEEGLTRVTTTLVQIPNDSNGNVAICHATVETAKGCFDGIGDASPTNVGRAIVPHLIRMSETRAVARAFRVAVNVGEALADDPSDEGREPSSATYASANANAAKAASAANAAYAESPRTEAREQRRAPGAERTRPGPEASPRQWFDYLAALARDHGIAVPPTPGPGVDNDEIVAQNSRLKAAIQAKQQTRQGGR